MRIRPYREPERVSPHHRNHHRHVPEWLQLAQSFVLYQGKHPEKADPKEGLQMGTIFFELYQPWRDPWENDHHHSIQDERGQ